MTNSETVYHRVHLFRLIPDTTQHRLRNEKREDQIRFVQKQKVAKQLTEKLSDGNVALFCDNEQQAETLSKNIFNNCANQCIFCGLPNHDSTFQNYNYAIILASKFNDGELSQGLSLLLDSPDTEVFLLFHAMSSEDWVIGATIGSFPQELFTINQFSIEDEEYPDMPENDDFDRVKCYALPFQGTDASYKFMWNDGYKGVYFLIEKNGEKCSEGYKYSSDLLELLNKEFNKKLPSKKLTKLIAEQFDADDDFEKIC